MTTYKERLQQTLQQLEDYDRVIRSKAPFSLKVDDRFVHEIRQYCRYASAFLEKDQDLLQAVEMLGRKLGVALGGAPTAPPSPAALAPEVAATPALTKSSGRAKVMCTEGIHGNGGPVHRDVEKMGGDFTVRILEERGEDVFVEIDESPYKPHRFYVPMDDLELLP